MHLTKVYNFHENTVFYKKELEEFMDQRKEVLNRFNQSSINFYDLTVVPNSEISHYDFIPRSIENLTKYITAAPSNTQHVIKLTSHDDYGRSRGITKNHWIG